jgi:hypothetical protein
MKVKPTKLSVRLLLLALSVALCFAAFAACSEKTEPGQPDVPVSAFTTEIDPLFDTAAMFSPDTDYMLQKLKLDDAAVLEFTMRLPTSTNLDEYGVFIAAPGREQDVENAVRKYCKTAADALMGYLPDEEQKIVEAEITANGKYVLYVMAEADTRTAAKSAFDAVLAE